MSWINSTKHIFPVRCFLLLEVEYATLGRCGGGVADFACRLNAEEREMERRRDFPEFSESQKRHGRLRPRHPIEVGREGSKKVSTEVGLQAREKSLPRRDFVAAKQITPILHAANYWCCVTNLYRFILLLCY